MKIIHVVSARPNFMKVAPIVRETAKYPDKFEQILVYTGQHYDDNLSKVFFEHLGFLRPDIYLGVGSGTHAEQTGKTMIEFEKVLFREKPNLVAVVGDVNFSLAAALAAVRLCVPIAHVEVGLRSFDRTMPEEIDRVLTDSLFDYLFTPSPDADNNLKEEGIPEKKIFLVGDVMVDSLLYNKAKAEKSDISERLRLVTSAFA